MQPHRSNALDGAAAVLTVALRRGVAVPLSWSWSQQPQGRACAAASARRGTLGRNPVQSDFRIIKGKLVNNYAYTTGNIIDRLYTCLLGLSLASPGCFTVGGAARGMQAARLYKLKSLPGGVGGDWRSGPLSSSTQRSPAQAMPPMDVLVVLPLAMPPPMPSSSFILGLRFFFLTAW